MKYSSWTIAVLLAMMACTGCKTTGMDWSKHMPWAETEPQKKVSPYPEPVHMVAIWSPAICNLPGKPATRGFGGRLYFYDSKDQAVPVDGNLMVFAFDDTSGDNRSTQPERRFAFTAEQITKHFSESELGASYSIWIPWDGVGNPKKEISLVSIFTTDKGNTVSGQPSRNLLPGPDDPQPKMRIEQFNDKPLVFRTEQNPTPYVPQPSEPTGYATQQVAYQQELVPTGKGELVAEQKMQTMSISLPGSLADRLAKAPPQQSLAQKYAAFNGQTTNGGASFAAQNPSSPLMYGPPSTTHSSQPPTYQPASVPRPMPAGVQNVPPQYYPQNPAASQNTGAPNSAPGWSAQSLRPWTPPDPRQARFERPRSLAPSGPSPQPAYDPLPSPQYLGGQPSIPPSSPQSGQLAPGQGAW